MIGADRYKEGLSRDASCSLLFFYSHCFVSLQFINIRQSVGLLGQGISSSQGCYLTQTDIHALSWILTHNPHVGTGEDILCLIPRVHGDRHRYLQDPNKFRGARRTQCKSECLGRVI
jgi:hypothetical protein